MASTYSLISERCRVTLTFGMDSPPPWCIIARSTTTPNRYLPFRGKADVLTERETASARPTPHDRALPSGQFSNFRFFDSQQQDRTDPFGLDRAHIMHLADGCRNQNKADDLRSRQRFPHFGNERGPANAPVGGKT